MLKNLRYLSLWQRRLVFFMVFGGILMAIVAVTWVLIQGALTGGARAQGAPLIDGVTVRQFATLPGDDAYPASVLVGRDGTVFTGSFSSGAIWRIAADGTVTEIAGSRDAIGAVSAIAEAPAPDLALLILDQSDPDPRTAGGRIMRLDARTGAVSEFATIDDERGFVSPNDMTVTPDGSIFVTDPGRNEVWRFTPDRRGAVWWVPPPIDPPPAGVTLPTRRGITGITYDPTTDSLLITDAELNEIYRVSVAAGESALIYRHPLRERPPGFDGITVTADGTIYVAALGTNSIARIDPIGTEAGGANGALTYIASGFRGASDVKATADGRLIVANFDQASLAPLPVRLFAPQLPFALDTITFSPNATP
jgi:streptogramin lyase